MPSIEPATVSTHTMAPLIDPSTLMGGVPPEDFRSAFRNHAAGVSIVTADGGDGPVAMTATSVFSVSATPPLVVFSVSSLSSATPAILRSKSLVIHLLDQSDVGLARLCSTSGVDRFADEASWDRLATGEPYFVSPRSRLRGDVVTTYEAGMSRLIVVHVTDSTERGMGEGPASSPLIYHNRTWLSLDTSTPLT